MKLSKTWGQSFGPKGKLGGNALPPREDAGGRAGARGLAKVQGSGQSAAGRGDRHRTGAAATRGALAAAACDRPSKEERKAREEREVGGGGRGRGKEEGKPGRQSLTVPSQTKDLAGAESPGRAG